MKNSLKAKPSTIGEMGIAYIDITENYRTNGMKPQSVVSDQLHTSPLIYQNCAEKLGEIMQRISF